MNHNTFSNNGASQFAFGFILAVLFSIMGLFAGLLFPERSMERLTFINGWKRGLLINIILIFFVILIYKGTFIF